MGIEVDGIGKRFGDFVALDDVDLDGAVGRADRAARAERRRQVDAAAHHRRAGGARHRHRATIDGADATTVPPQRRNVGFVFQHYAAFKHLSVYRNVAFGLEIRKRPKAEIRKRVHELLELVHLDQFADRLPAQLSGGQRQRMALARALAVEPKVLLLDEPFGALDAKVRKELRDWLRRLHDEVHVTTVFVTHDQEEALEVSDEIVVINDGRIEQVGTPGRAVRQAGQRLRDELPRPGDDARRAAGAPARHRGVHRTPVDGAVAAEVHPAAASRVRGAGRAGGGRRRRRHLGPADPRPGRVAANSRQGSRCGCGPHRTVRRSPIGA